MGRVHGSPVEYSSYDVTYAAGCRERVTRTARLHGIIKKIETGEGRGEGGRGGRRRRRRRRKNAVKKENSDKFLLDSRRELAGWLTGLFARSLARSVGTYAYTCPRVRTVGFIWKSR